MASSSKYFCESCGYESKKWLGKCPECNSWSSFVEAPKTKKTDAVFTSSFIQPQILSNIASGNENRIQVNIEEFDRVIGGGFVTGSLTLIGGDPGIGKSTIVLQISRNISNSGKKVLYISGEESEQQIKIRANRLGDFSDNFLVLSESDLDKVIQICLDIKPDVLIIDSIQTMINPNINSVAGSVSQVKESTALLLNLAKSYSINVIIIGHVTKEGTVAGPRLLEHMVDTVLYIEGQRHDSYRILRGVKNRFGSTNEIGVFEMSNKGLIEVDNPSKLMLDGRPIDEPGSIVTCVIEGTRPILIEIQALVSKTNLPVPRRTTIGVDQNRVNVLMAVLEKRLNISLSSYDAYVNIIGGMRVQETAIDLPIVLAILSSYYNKAFGSNIVSFGEVGLVGEVRGVSYSQKRILEAKKIGFNTIIMPYANLNNCNNIEGVKLTGIKEIQQLTNK